MSKGIKVILFKAIILMLLFIVCNHPSRAYASEAPAAPSAPDLISSSDTGFSNRDNITKNNTPTFSGTATANITVRLYDTDGTTVIGSGTADASGNWSITASTLSDGEHTITAKAVDAASNESTASEALTVVIDTIAPAILSIPDLTSDSDTGSSDTDNITADNTPTFSGTAEANTYVLLYYRGGGWLIGGVYADGSGNWTITVSTLSDFMYTITAAAKDVAGNESTDSEGLTVTIDTIAPAAPSAPDLISSSDTGSSDTDNTTKYSTPTFSGTAEANTTVRLYDTAGTTVIGSGTADASGNWTITASTLSDGEHTITAKAIDVAGNESAASGALTITIDTIAPAAKPSIPDLTSDSDTGSSDTDNITADMTPTFSGTAEANIEVVLYKMLDARSAERIGTRTADGSGNWTITAVALTDGEYEIVASAQDVAGNGSSIFDSEKLTVVIDTVAPAAPSAPDLISSSDTGLSNTDNITNDTTPTISGTAEANSTVTLYNTDGTTVLGTATANGSGDWTITTSTLTDGSYSITAKTTDVAGNESPASGALTIVIDTVAQAPSTPDLASSSDTGSSDMDNITADKTPTISGTAEANSTVTLYDTDGTTVLGTATANGSGDWTIITSTLTDGEHTITAKAVDVAGNVSTASSALSIRIDTSAPTIVTISPSNNATGISITGNIVITFDSAMNTTVGTVQLNSLTTLTGGQWSNGNKTYTIPYSALGHNASHTIKVTDFEDAAGNVMSDNTSNSFTTISVMTPPPSYTAPAPIIPPREVRRTDVNGMIGTTSNAVATVDIVREISEGRKVDTIVLDQAKTEEAIKRILEQEQDTLQIVVSGVPKDNADEIKITINKYSVKKLADSNVAIEVKTEDVSIQVPRESLRGISENIEDIYFRIIPIENEEQLAKTKQQAITAGIVKEAANGNEVIVLGTPMTIETNYQGFATKIVFSLKGIAIPSDKTLRAEFLSGLGVYIEHSDGEQVFNRGIIQYDEAGNPAGIEIEISKFSSFTIISIKNETPKVENKAPKAVSVKLTGKNIVGNKLKVSYTYKDSEKDKEGKTTIQWYRADNAKGDNKQKIKGAKQLTYTLTKQDIGKYIIVEITPIAKTGKKTGKKVTVITKATVAEKPITYTSHVKLGIMKSKSSADEVAAIIKKNYPEAHVTVKKEGKSYRIYLDFVNKATAQTACKAMKKKGYIANYYFYTK